MRDIDDDFPVEPVDSAADRALIARAIEVIGPAADGGDAFDGDPLGIDPFDGIVDDTAAELVPSEPVARVFRLRNEFQADLPFNIIDCAQRGLPMVAQATQSQGPALVVGKGPSLTDPATWEQVLAAAEGATVFAVKDNAQWLRDRGLNPRFVVNADQRPDLAERIQPDPSLVYLLASCCHPSLFDSLLGAGCEVRVFHFACGARWMGMPELQLYRSLFADDWVAVSGSTIVNRSVPLLYRMGFERPVVLAGADFGARDLAGGYYAADMPGRIEKPLTTASLCINDGGRFDGRVWYSRPDLIVSARSVAHLVRGGWVRVIGDSLANALAAKSEAEASAEMGRAA